MLFIIYLILTPILCLLGMLMLEHLERKIKTALAKKRKPFQFAEKPIIKAVH